MAPEFGALGAASPGAPSPMTSPTGPSPLTAPPQEGVRAGAHVKLGIVVKGLIDVLAAMKSEINSDEGKAVLKALNILAPFTPEVSEGLGQSEIAAMMGRAQAVRPGGPPGQPSMLGIPRPNPQVIAGAPLGPR